MGRVTRRDGYVGGARGVTACDGRQPLDVGAQQLRERLGLGLAQLRELRGHVGDRTVVLAKLRADVLPKTGCFFSRIQRTDLTGRRSVAFPAQRGREGLRADHRVARRGDRRAVRPDQLLDAAFGEGAHGVFTGVLGEEADGGHGQVVVGVPEPGAAGLGQQEQLRRAAPPAGAAARRVPGLGLTVGEQRVEVPPDGGG